jgi:hypothetical protein
MNKFFTLFVFVSWIATISAQSFQKISTGPGYNRQSYVRIMDGTEKQVSNDAWDLAFTAYGFQDAGIFINESSGSTMGQNVPTTELYDTKSNDFSITFDVEAIKDNKYLNSEESWNFGAFNEGRVKTDPFDFGWGKYNPQMQRVEGKSVFILKLRNGNFKKIKIETLTGTTYTLKYTDINGANEVTKTINKMADSKGQKLIFFSFASNSVVDILPQGGFDLMYGRYSSLAKDPNGTIEQQYNVTGVLTGIGVKTAVAKGVNPVTVKEADYANQYSTRTDVIGHDWKTLVGTSWSMATDRAFFVKTADNRVWKLVFIDFEGAATGNAVFEKTDLGISSSNDIEGLDSGIFPNPVQDELIISLDIKNDVYAQMQMYVSDASGRMIVNQNVNTNNGLNVFTINTNEWNPGVYFVNIIAGSQSVSKKVVKI